MLRLHRPDVVARWRILRVCTAAIWQVLEIYKSGLSQKRLFMENSLFLAWVSEQEAKGRPESELIFGNFVRERFAN